MTTPETEKNISAQSKVLHHLDVNVSVYVVSMKRQEKCNILAEVVYTTQHVEVA
jgi:hypothetical protein